MASGVSGQSGHGALGSAAVEFIAVIDIATTHLLLMAVVLAWEIPSRLAPVARRVVMVTRTL